MLYTTIVLFALAAIVGVVILKNWLTSAHTSRTIVYLHGIFAAVALVTLAVYAFQNPGNYPKISIILFVFGALIGFYMFAEDLKKIQSYLAGGCTRLVWSCRFSIASIFCFRVIFFYENF